MLGLLFSCFVFGAHAEGPAPVINISLLAPEQKDSPLHILSFEYKVDSLQIVLSNASSKSVVGAAIVGVMAVPPGCVTDATKSSGTGTIGGSIYPLRIGPHETRVTAREGSPFGPAGLIMFARDFSAGGYLQVQVRVLEVDFADGTRWREDKSQALFDSSVVEADSGKCPNADRVAKALTYIKQVKFDLNLEREKSADGDSRGGGIPRLSFACTLEGTKAVCPGRQ